MWEIVDVIKEVIMMVIEQFKRIYAFARTVVDGTKATLKTMFGIEEESLVENYVARIIAEMNVKTKKAMTQYLIEAYEVRIINPTEDDYEACDQQIVTFKVKTTKGRARGILTKRVTDKVKRCITKAITMGTDIFIDVNLERTIIIFKEQETQEEIEDKKEMISVKMVLKIVDGGDTMEVKGNKKAIIKLSTNELLALELNEENAVYQNGKYRSKHRCKKLEETMYSEFAIVGDEIMLIDVVVKSRLEGDIYEMVLAKI